MTPLLWISYLRVYLNISELHDTTFIKTTLVYAYNNSLFSGNLTPSLHRRSGKAGQWERYFTPAHKTRFLELFGDALITLDYEENHDWVYHNT